MSVEEAYFLLRCDRHLASNLDLLQVSAEIPVKTKHALQELVFYLVKKAYERELLGKIVSCPRDFGRGCMNVFEHIERNIERSPVDAHARIDELHAMRELL